MARSRSIVWTMEEDKFRDLISRHKHFVNILEELGYARTSGSMTKIVAKRIKELGINTSHMKKSHTKGGVPTIKIEDILKKDSSYSNITILKKRLVLLNLLEYKCIICGNIGEWNERKLVLQLDHINGVHNDHRLENLRFLCPNCHTQTSTFSGRNSKNFTKSQ